MSRFLSGIFGSLMKSQPVIEKRLKNTCFLKENFEEIDQDDLLKMLSFLQGRSETKQPEAISALFTHIKDCGELSLQRRLKYLALIHKSIKKVGFEFAEEFLASRPNNLREKPAVTTTQSSSKQKQKPKAAVVFQYIDIESWLEEYVVKHYYDYLMRMSLNLETYKTCLLSDKEPQFTGHTQPVSAANPLRMMVLFKVSNLVNFIMKLQKQFMIIFSEFKFIAVAKDIAYMVLKDCVVYYNYMHRQIMNMVTNYESMIENDQMQFYELFIELIKLNSALHDFGKLRKFFDDDESIEQPLVLNITKERARQIDRNHRKIVLKNEEIQRDRKLRLQQQMNGGTSGGGGASGTQHGKRLSFLSKQGGSMTSRGTTSWKENVMIREVTNDDEEDDQKTKYQKPTGGYYKRPQNNSLANTDAMWLKMNNINLESMYGQEDHAKGGDVAGSLGFNTDRVVYSNHHPESTDAHDEDKSDSTKESKKEDTFTKSKSRHEIQEQ